MKTCVLCFSRRKLFECDDPVAVALERGPQAAGRLLARAVRRVGEGRQRRQPLGLLGPDAGLEGGRHVALDEGRIQICGVGLHVNDCVRRSGDSGAVAAVPCGDARGGTVVEQAARRRSDWLPPADSHQCSGRSYARRQSRRVRATARRRRRRGLRQDRTSAAVGARSQLGTPSPDRDVERLLRTGQAPAHGAGGAASAVASPPLTSKGVHPAAGRVSSSTRCTRDAAAVSDAEAAATHRRSLAMQRSRDAATPPHAVALGRPDSAPTLPADRHVRWHRASVRHCRRAPTAIGTASRPPSSVISAISRAPPIPERGREVDAPSRGRTRREAIAEQDRMRGRS